MSLETSFALVEVVKNIKNVVVKINKKDESSIKLDSFFTMPTFLQFLTLNSAIANMHETWVSMIYIASKHVSMAF